MFSFYNNIIIDINYEWDRAFPSLAAPVWSGARLAPYHLDTEETGLDNTIGTKSQIYTRYPIFCNTLNNISVLGHFASKGVSYEDAQVN